MGRRDLRLAPAQAAFIHGQQRVQQREIARRVIGGRQQRGQDAGAHQNQRLAAFPIAAECSQRLAGAALAFLLGLHADLLRGEHTLDQGGRVA